MHRPMIRIIAFIFLFLLVPTLLYGGDLGELSKKISPAIVAIQVEVSPQEELKALRSGKAFRSWGSGVIIDPKGYILTANPLLLPGKKIKVFLTNGRRVYAKMVARDRKNQIALLKIPGKHAFLPIRDSRKAFIGQFVVTAGNTYTTLARQGKCSISLGVLSDRYLLLYGQGYHGMVLETTAGVNPGSYGGALVDLQGRLIGIISPFYSRKKWLGLAIPTRSIQLALPYLKKGESPPAGRLGLALLQKGQMGGRRKVVVEELLPSGPAWQAGFLSGDIIERVESRKISLLSQLDLLLKDLPAGTEVEFVLLRGKSRRVVTLELGLPNHTSAPWPKLNFTLQKKPSKPLVAPPIQPKFRPKKVFKTSPKGKKVLGLLVSRPLSERGFFVRTVIKNSPADKVGILPGDQIISLENQKISTLKEGLALLKKNRKINLQLEIRRGSWQKKIYIQKCLASQIGSTRQVFPATLGQWGVVFAPASNRVQAIIPKSHAFFYGLKKGDKILLINGHPLSAEGSFPPAGSPITLTIQRRGWRATLSFYRP